jgi:hypothetical protein
MKGYDRLMGIVEVITGDRPTLYLAEQLEHALNAFHTLISLLRNSKIRICLNRVGGITPGVTPWSICLAKGGFDAKMSTQWRNLQRRW